jgi:hypothetical protein
MNVNINFDKYQFNNTLLFNLSAIKENDKYVGLLRARNITSSHSYPLYVEINESGTIHKLHEFNINNLDFSNCNNTGIEDARLFKFKNEYWAIANCLGHKDQQFKCVNTMCIFNLKDPNGTFKFLHHPTNPEVIQKNWSPFEYDGKLYCEYSIKPHYIFEIDPYTGIVNGHNIIKTDTYFSPFSKIRGRLSGGTPPILITHFRNKVYLALGHVRLSDHSYYHFFYMFENRKPFKIIGMSEIFKFDTIDERIQFAGSLSLEGDVVHVSYGINDNANKITTYNIYDINNMIKYDVDYMMHYNVVKDIKGTAKHRLTIIVDKDMINNSISEYCVKYGYDLISDINDRKNVKGKILYLRSCLEQFDMSMYKNFDDIIDMSGDSEYILFQDDASFIINDVSLVNSVDKNMTGKHDINLDTVLEQGYPYRENKGCILHKNHLKQILYFRRYMEFNFNYGNSDDSNYNGITIMPNIIPKTLYKYHNTSKIPKIIHQSFETRMLPECLAHAAHTWTNLNPDYDYKYYDNGDRRQLIVDHFNNDDGNNDVLRAYDKLIPGAYRCDLWRFCVVYVYGGIYIDIKNGCTTPLSSGIVDNDCDYLLVNDTNDHTMYNAVFGAKAKDPIILKVINEITRRVLAGEYGSHNLYPTGPMAMGSVILKEFGMADKKHMPVGKYNVNGKIVRVYDHHNDGNNGRIISNNDGHVLINTRHNPKTLDQKYFQTITGNPNYGVLWNEKRIYRNM